MAADESYLATVTGERPARPLPTERLSLETLADVTRQLDVWHHGIAVGLMQEV